MVLGVEYGLDPSTSGTGFLNTYELWQSCCGECCTAPIPLPIDPTGGLPSTQTLSSVVRGSLQTRSGPAETERENHYRRLTEAHMQVHLSWTGLLSIFD